MKRKSASFLAGVLVASMVATPLSYTNVYAQEQDVVEADAAQTESESDVVSDNTDNVSENVSEKENTEKSESAIPAQQENKNAESVDKSNVENEPVQTEQKNESVTQEAAPQDSIVPVQPTEAISGVKVLKNDGNEYGMFPIVVEKMEVKDNQVTIDFNTGEKSVFDWLYLGPVTDSEKTGYTKGEKANGTCKFSITVPLSKQNSWIPVAAGRSDKGTWSENYLWMSVPNVEVITGQPNDVKAKEGENVKLSVSASEEDVSYQWQYSADGTNWTDCDGENATTANYSFTMKKSSEGKYRCIVNKSYIKETSNTATITFVDDDKKDDGKTDSDNSGDNTGSGTTAQEGYVASDGITSIYASDDTKKPGQPYTMFKIGASEAKVVGDKIQVSIWVEPASSGNFSYDAIYIGNGNDKEKEPLIIGEEDTKKIEGKKLERFTFEVPLSMAGKEVHYVPRNGRTQKFSTTSSLALKLPALSDFKKQTVITIQSQPIAKMVAKAGDKISLFIDALGEEGTTLSYQWQYSDDGESWTNCKELSAGTDNYTFTMEEKLAGKYRCIVKDNTGTEIISDISEITFQKVSEKEGYVASNGITAIYASDDTKKPGQPYTMFSIGASEAKVVGEKIQISIWVEPASSGNFSYDAIYIGDKNDEPKEPLVLGEVDTEKNLEKFSFEVPLSMAGKEVHYVPRNGRTQKFSTSSALALTIPSLDAFKKQTEIVIQSQPKDVAAKNDTQVSLSVIANGEESAKLSYQWQYSADGTSWIDCEGISAKNATYTFEMASDKVGQYRCVITDSNGTTATSNIAKVENPSAPAVTSSQVQVVKSDGSTFKMFTVKESKVQEDGENLKVTISTQNVSFDKIYLGEKEDVIKTPVTDGTVLENGGYTFTFQVPASDKGKVLPISLGKSDGTWYNGQDLWIYIPNEGIESLPTVSDEVKTIVGGTGVAYSDFEIVSSKAVLRGDKVNMTLDVKGSKWTRLYLGVQADTNKTPVYKGTYNSEKNVTTFSFDVSAEKQGMNIAVTPGNDTWFSYARDLFINIPNLENKANTTENGVYNLYGSAYPTTNMIGLNFERESSVSINGDQATITWVTQAARYDKLYIGNPQDSNEVKEANAIEAKDRSDIASGYKSFTFTLPVTELGKEFSYSVRDIKDGTWTTSDARAYINGILEKTGELPTPDPDPTPDPNPGVVVPENGIYKVNNVTSSSSMFNVVDCKLTSKNGKMSAVLTLSGTGYGYLYMGTKEEAAKADSSSWIPFVTDNNGKYTYTVPVEALDKEINVAAYSTKNKIWYDRILTFKSETVKKISDIDSGNGGTGGNSGTTGGNTNPSGGTGGSGSVLKPNDGKAENESKYEADTSGATGRVNSSTTLADGVYTPDRFTWSGGTGKVKIYCNKITIKNGQAYATLVFDSDHYQYVKANGNTYYTSKSGGTATVTIPVALNQNNKILGMTDKMSVAHEIEYTIFVYLAAAGNGTTLGGANANKKLDEKAPEIMGLQYQSETQLDYAEYFKIYHYDQGITLLEIDMTKGTANDPEKLAAEAINAENIDAETADTSGEAQTDQDKQQATESKNAKSSVDEEETSAVTTAEDGEENLNGVSEAELAAELYKGNIVKYLLVPEGVEVPVGLDQDMIVVQLPADKAYTSTEAILEKMDELGLTDNIVAIGDKKKDCKIDSIAEKMEKKDGEDHTQVVYGGAEEEPDYKTLVKQETNLAVLSSNILPKEADITDIQEKQDVSEDTDKEEKTEKKSTKKSDDKSKKKSAKKSDEKAEKKSEDQEKLTVEEQTERYQQMTEKFALLGIPVIVDRSEDEQTDLAKYEWIKVYGVLFGCEDQMNNLFDQAVKDAGDDAVSQAKVQTEK
ncbi:immunoglobulin domain-containing protein [Dorea sp. AGR2135]|uniref:immunoglobulin domain-containing protein n=1 Tax=Dorea sp. AGR2135 TaxID=1280669 RepID=UPI0004166570|nr:immunoglobulin domain-containing protein [Dorea sp. AGR2135]